MYPYVRCQNVGLQYEFSWVGKFFQYVWLSGARWWNSVSCTSGSSGSQIAIACLKISSCFALSSSAVR